MEKITLKELLEGLRLVEARDHRRCTLLGIGPMSANLLEAAFTLARQKGCPLLFIASRNQVDADELGGGYVCAWDQKRFCDDIARTARACEFDGLYYICRDHGGPWQRDQERWNKLPAREAMELGKRSYAYDLKAGFDLLHIDPTKLPTETGVVPMELVLEYTVELIGFCEGERKRLGLPPVDYEVGTEETNGGLTGADEYQRFIEELNGRLESRGLPKPVFIVGQTGTLTRMTSNVGHYNRRQAMALSAIARRHGVGLKEHNGDYLDNANLGEHPALGIAATNVGPEYGAVETRAWLTLAEMERNLHECGLVPRVSGFQAALTRQAVLSGRWKKWTLDRDRDLTPDDILGNEQRSRHITELCGHYVFDQEAVKAERRTLVEHLRGAGLDPRAFVVNEISRSLERHMDCFNLEGISGRVMEALGKQ